jgi:hypothetical protein
LFCAYREKAWLIPRNCKALRRSRGVARLSIDVARDPLESHAWPFGGPFLTQTLDRLSVSRGLGYREVGFALSVATYRGWLREEELAEIEMWMPRG